jgi:hypothetical protein
MDTDNQIKGRQITRFNGSRQLSAIRNLAGAHSDFLAGVLLSQDYSVMRGALIPHAVALEGRTPTAIGSCCAMTSGTLATFAM